MKGKRKHQREERKKRNKRNEQITINKQKISKQRKQNRTKER